MDLHRLLVSGCEAGIKLKQKVHHDNLLWSLFLHELQHLSKRAFTLRYFTAKHVPNASAIKTNMSAIPSPIPSPFPNSKMRKNPTYTQIHHLIKEKTSIHKCNSWYTKTNTKPDKPSGKKKKAFQRK